MLHAVELITYFHITISASICKALFRAQMALGVWMGFLDPCHALPPWSHPPHACSQLPSSVGTTRISLVEF